MIIIDSSIWIDHIRKPLAAVVELLADQQVVQHPFVTAELALGSLAQRERFLRAMSFLPTIDVVQQAPWHDFVSEHALFGTGVGFVDAHLLASAVTFDHRLWSRDKRLAGLALQLDCAFEPNIN